MTIAVQSEPERVGRTPGPLAPFLQRLKDGSDTRLLRQSGADASESAGKADKPHLSCTSLRSAGTWRNPKRRHRRNRGGSPSKTTDSGRQQTTKRRRTPGASANHDRHGSKANKIIRKRTWTAPTINCLQCGEPVRYPNETRCEDCFADDQKKWHGRPLRVKLETPEE